MSVHATVHQLQQPLAAVASALQLAFPTPLEFCRGTAWYQSSNSDDQGRMPSRRLPYVSVMQAMGIHRLHSDCGS